MATTITLQGSVNFSQAFLGWKQLGIGTNFEPAVTSGNIILQTMVSPPFSFNFNRSSATINATAGTQDYVTAAATFGFIEKASYQIPAATITNTALTAGTATYTAANTFQTGDLVTITSTTNGSGIFNTAAGQTFTIQSATSALFTVLINNPNIGSAGDTGTALVGTTTEISQVANILGTGSEQGSPNQIAPQIDDNAGNITFRLLPVPNRSYTVTVVFQKKVPLMTTLSSTWAPIPDHYSYIYQWGFLALMQAYNYDVRWAQSSQKFVAGLLAVAEGLSEENKNIFQSAWLNTITEQQVKGMTAQQGVQERQI